MDQPARDVRGKAHEPEQDEDRNESPEHVAAPPVNAGV
jgi:hypothetical protein